VTEAHKVLGEALLRGSNLRIFANGAYQEISEISFDGCGSAVVRLKEPLKVALSFEEEVAAHVAHHASGYLA
jgi:hypothetical protein